MRAAETLVSGLATPAPACLLGLVLAVLAWLDGGEYRREQPHPGSRSNFPA